MMLGKALSLAKPSHQFAYQWLDNFKLNKYAKVDPNIPYGSNVINNFTADHPGQNDAQQTLVHQKKAVTHASG